MESKELFSTACAEVTFFPKPESIIVLRAKTKFGLWGEQLELPSFQTTRRTKESLYSSAFSFLEVGRLFVCKTSVERQFSKLRI